MCIFLPTEESSQPTKQTSPAEPMEVLEVKPDSSENSEGIFSKRNEKTSEESSTKFLITAMSGETFSLSDLIEQITVKYR